ncbi:MAG: replication initiator protein A [Clostridium sp.]
MEKFKYVLENEIISGRYINIPIKLYSSPSYTGLSNDAILLYGVLRNNFKFSAQCGLRDEEGRLFVIAPLSEIMKIIRCSRNTARKILEELKKYNLIKVSDDDDKNRLRNIYVGDIKIDGSEVKKADENKKYEASSKENRSKKSTDKGLEREPECIKKSTSKGSEKEPGYIKKSTDKGLEKEPKYIKKSTSTGSKYEQPWGQNVNPNKNIYKNTYKKSGFEMVSGDGYPYYKDFDFED